MTKVGRPPKLTEAEREEVYEALEKYIARTPDPILVGFVAWDPVPNKYNVTIDNINDWEEFSILRKRATTCQEAYLATGLVSGKLNATGCIFRLKQPVHGYKDRTETDVTSGGKQIQPIVGGLAKIDVPTNNDDPETSPQT